MINVTAQELETILATIDKALAMHEVWREQLQRILICKLPPHEEDMADDAHRNCAFGQWYYGPSNAHLRKLSGFQKIEEMHKIMHGSARDLCIRLKAHWPISQKEYDPYVSQLTRFRSELLGLRQKVFETLHKIDPLTGAYRSLFLLPELEKDQAEKKSTGKPYSLLLLRLDLRTTNESLGMDKGNELLRGAIAGVRKILDIGDKIYRYAGAEFVICLPGRNHDQANEIRGHMVEVVGKALTNVAGGSSTSMEIHYGIVELEPDTYVEQLIHQAKRASYTITI